MKKVWAVLLIALFILTFSSLSAAEKASQEVYDLAGKKLAAYGTDAVIVKAVQEKNSMGETLDQVKAMDKKWRDTPGIADFMEAMVTGECGKHLKEIQNSVPYFAEIFVMDQNGANVAMTDKTSDYWQGDEAKFKESFNNGKGAVFVDEVEFDDSAQTYLVQVSVPVMDGDRAIGAITFGIDIDAME
jgi:hypothetical protein